MIIKKKADVIYFLENFSYFAKGNLQKWYILFNGTTLMQYPDNSFSYHRKNDLLCDLHETPFDEVKEIEKFVWERRKSINVVLAGINKKEPSA